MIGRRAWAGRFTPENSATLLDLVKAPTVTSTEQYLRDLQAAGFVDLEVVDLSDTWTTWTQVGGWTRVGVGGGGALTRRVTTPGL